MAKRNCVSCWVKPYLLPAPLFLLKRQSLQPPPCHRPHPLIVRNPTQHSRQHPLHWDRGDTLLRWGFVLVLYCGTCTISTCTAMLVALSGGLPAPSPPPLSRRWRTLWTNLDSRSQRYIDSLRTGWLLKRRRWLGSKMREDTHETLYIMPDQHSECTNDVIILLW